MSEILKIFGKRIKELRKKNNMSQEKLAEKTGIHRTYLGVIERGEKSISIEIIEKLSKALNISISELFKDL